MKLSRCPYCGRRIRYFSAFMYKNQGEYICNRCNRESTVFIRKAIYMAFAAAAGLALLILILFLIFGNAANLIGLVLVCLPFIAFYAISPMFVKLIPDKKYRIPRRPVQRTQTASVESDSATAPLISDSAIGDKTIDRDVFRAIKAERRKFEESIEQTRHIEKPERGVKTYHRGEMRKKPPEEEDYFGLSGRYTPRIKTDDISIESVEDYNPDDDIKIYRG